MAGPIVAMTMLTSALAGPSVAVFSQTVVAFLMCLSRATPVDMMGASWLAGAVAAHAVNPLKRRSDLMRAATVQALSMALLAACISAISTDHVRPVLESAGWAALAGIGATSIFWLIVAAEERLFGIVSDWTLLELCSPDQPLIRELCLRAPGTYAHSVMVAHLAESAAREIGANPVLCRAMAYFHDVGKIERPSFFAENQIGENPHDGLSPNLSANIIAAHVRDGLELAKQHGLPQVIRDGIVQHHGTSLIAYFYDRAKTQNGDEPVLEQFFRYEGPKPQTKEIAVLMLADAVEAVSRTIPRRDTELLEATVWRLVDEKRADGQLDECDLTLRELQVVQRSFIHALGALRHDRIAYPGQEQHDPSIETAHLRVQRIAQADADPSN
jgi:putative nucleotidyltransferase with HDIG domain